MRLDEALALTGDAMIEVTTCCETFALEVTQRMQGYRVRRSCRNARGERVMDDPEGLPPLVFADLDAAKEVGVRAIAPAALLSREWEPVVWLGIY